MPAMDQATSNQGFLALLLLYRLDLVGAEHLQYLLVILRILQGGFIVNTYKEVCQGS